MYLSDKARESLQKVVDRFKAGDIGPITKIVRIRLSEELPASRWSLSNRILAYAQSGEVDCRGFRQWKQAGRTVKKGERACYILGPKTRKIEEDGEERTIVTGFTAIPVFARHQTEGEPLPDEEPPAELPPLMGVAERMGVAVEWRHIPGAYGSYSPTKERIRMGTHDEAVFFHELAHAAHKRVLGQLAGGQDAHQETVAELTAAVLCDLYGRDHTGTSWEYISGYNDDPLGATLKALSDVGKVLEVIFEEEPCIA